MKRMSKELLGAEGFLARVVARRIHQDFAVYQ